SGSGALSSGGNRYGWSQCTRSRSVRSCVSYNVRKSQSRAYLYLMQSLRQISQNPDVDSSFGSTTTAATSEFIRSNFILRASSGGNALKVYCSRLSLLSLASSSSSIRILFTMVLAVVFSSPSCKDPSSAEPIRTETTLSSCPSVLALRQFLRKFAK